MTREPVQAVQTLREDLDAFEMSAAELGRRIEGPVNQTYGNPECLPRRHRLHGDAFVQAVESARAFPFAPVDFSD